MSAELATAKQIKAYGMRLIPDTTFDVNTMIDVSSDVTESVIIPDDGMIVIPYYRYINTKSSGKIIDGNSTTLLDMSAFGDVSNIDTNSFTTDPSYGVSWGVFDWANRESDFVITSPNITEVEIEWSGLLSDNALGEIYIIFNYGEVGESFNSFISDAWSNNAQGQSYYQNEVAIFDEQVTEVINDRFTIIPPIGTNKINVSIHYLNGYNKSPRWINYLAIKSDEYL